MNASRPRVAAVWLALAAGCALAQSPPGVPAQDAGTAEAAPAASGGCLDPIRDALVGLRFEQALEALGSLLAGTDLSDAERDEALALRSQAHVALGDLDAAEQDYREILLRQPAFAPDPSLTPRKALERFEKVRVALVGLLVLDVEPPDASVTVDGRQVAVEPGGRVPLLAGEHVVAVARPGFDPQERTVQVEANQDARLELRLVPNARTVVLSTAQAGVTVALDGTPVGRTALGPGDGPGPARLTVENLPLGEHVFELSLACHRTERIRELLTVDLLSWGPRILPPVSLVPVRSTLVLREGPTGATVQVDGEPSGRLPVEPIEVCPGEREIEVHLDERLLWRHVASVVEDEEAVLRVTPRPNAVWLGEPAPPPAVEERFNVHADPRASVPEDPTSPAAWAGLPLSADVDLVLAERGGAAGEPALWLYSPILRAVAPFDGDPGVIERPRWTGATWGVSIVDSRRRGPAVVAEVLDGGGAARAELKPGDRIVSFGGTQVVDAAQARRILAMASPSAPLDAEWLSPSGVVSRGRIEGRSTLRLDPGPRSDVARAALRAAWAMVDGVADGAMAPSARANLALLLSEFGRPEAAVAVWRRVELPERAGIGRGTVLYYLGRDLQRAGSAREAAEALRLAATSEATVLDDAGPRVAPAASNRLLDLGAGGD